MLGITDASITGRFFRPWTLSWSLTTLDLSAGAHPAGADQVPDRAAPLWVLSGHRGSMSRWTRPRVPATPTSFESTTAMRAGRDAAALSPGPLCRIAAVGRWRRSHALGRGRLHRRSDVVRWRLSRPDIVDRLLARGQDDGCCLGIGRLASVSLPPNRIRQADDVAKQQV